MSIRTMLPATTLLLFLGGWALLSPAAYATSVVWTPLPDLGDRSHLIVIGEVLATSTLTIESGFGIYTDTEITVRDTVKGAPLGRLTVRLPGGTHGDTTTFYDGVPSFQVGETYLLVLYGLEGSRYGGSADDTFYVPLGLSQGVWLLSETPDGVVANRDLVGAAFVHPDGTTATAQQHTRMPLEALTTALLSALGDSQ